MLAHRIQLPRNQQPHRDHRERKSNRSGPRRKPHHHRRVRLEQCLHHPCRVLRCHAAIAQHCNTITRLEIGAPNPVGDEIGEGTITGIPGTAAVEIDQQRRTSRDRQSERSERAEQTVLRRPDGERRNVSRS